MTSKKSKPKMTQYGCLRWNDLYEHNSQFLIYIYIWMLIEFRDPRNNTVVGVYWLMYT